MLCVIFMVSIYLFSLHVYRKYITLEKVISLRRTYLASHLICIAFLQKCQNNGDDRMVCSVFIVSINFEVDHSLIE